MKTVNNKINKPIISIGFDKNGKVTFNVDLNKTNKLNAENLRDINIAINNIKKVIIGDTNDIKKIKGITLQKLKIINDFILNSGITFPNIVTLDELVDVETCIKNNRKLQAVKTFKEAAGCGLKDGKNFVEWYAAKLKFAFNYEKNHKFYYEIQ